MNAKFKEARNGDVMMALGRVLYNALDDTALMTKARVRENCLAEDEPFDEAYLVFTRGGSRQWLKPDEMEILTHFGISVEPKKRDNWENTRYAEFRLSIPDDVLEAYEAAVDEYGVPEAPRKWDKDARRKWAHSNVMRFFGPDEE